MYLCRLVGSVTQRLDVRVARTYLLHFRYACSTARSHNATRAIAEAVRLWRKCVEERIERWVVLWIEVTDLNRTVRIGIALNSHFNRLEKAILYVNYKRHRLLRISCHSHCRCREQRFSTLSQITTIRLARVFCPWLPSVFMPFASVTHA